MDDAILQAIREALESSRTVASGITGADGITVIQDSSGTRIGFDPSSVPASFSGMHLANGSFQYDTDAYKFLPSDVSKMNIPFTGYYSGYFTPTTGTIGGGAADIILQVVVTNITTSLIHNQNRTMWSQAFTTGYTGTIPFHCHAVAGDVLQVSITNVGFGAVALVDVPDAAIRLMAKG